VKDVERARVLAERLLAAQLPDRWRHVQGVAAWAEEVSKRVGVMSADLLAAAWLHDIGYAPNLVSTGLHPLDGVRYLRAEALTIGLHV
jgi:HD superfamily phosphodiesterase